MAQARSTGNDMSLFTLLASALTMQPLGHDSPMPAHAGTVTGREGRRRGWLERLDHWFWTQEQRATEAHLAAATDIYDLEVRIRELERGARPWSD